MHQETLSKIREKDKRKVHKTFRLGPILAVDIFQSIKNLEYIYGDNFAHVIKPYFKGAKRIGDELQDEPLSIRTKIFKQDTIVDRDKLVSELQATRYSKVEALKTT